MELEEKKLAAIEYQATQSSAQHADQLVWTVTSIMWASSLLLLGFIVNALNRNPPTPYRILLTALAVLGLALTVCVWRLAFQLNHVKNQKYERCKKLEDVLSFEQHTKLQYRSGSQRELYSIVMTLFLLVWATVIVIIWWPM